MAKLDGAAEAAMALHGINDPFVGQSQGMGRQQEIADFARKSRIIAGPGVRVTQTEQGIVVEAVDINQTFTYMQEREVHNAVIGEIERVFGSGIYSIKFITENTISTSDFLVEVNNSMLEENQYAEGDRVLCFPINMPVVKGGYIVDE